MYSYIFIKCEIYDRYFCMLYLKAYMISDVVAQTCVIVFSREKVLHLGLTSTAE